MQSYKTSILFCAYFSYYKKTELTEVAKMYIQINKKYLI